MRLLTVGLAFTLFCGAPSHLSGQIAVESDDYAVYTAILQQQLNPQNQRVVVNDSTMLGPGEWHLEGLQRRAPDLPPELMQEFRERNPTRRRLEDRFTLSVPVHVASRSDLSWPLPSGSMGPSEYWEEFYRRYPGAAGIAAFSRVAYDQTHTRALVGFNWRCGRLCDFLIFVLLHREGEEWHVERRIGLIAA